MKSFFPCLILPAVLVFSGSPELLAADQPASRTFEIQYHFSVFGVSPGKTVRIWCPVPSSSPQQTVTLLSGIKHRLTQDPVYGTHIAYVESAAPTSGGIDVSLDYRVLRHEVVQAPTASTELIRLDEAERQKWLQSNRLVSIRGPQLKLLQKPRQADSVFVQSRQLYDTVLNHVDYRKDKPGWGRGDAEWVCDSRFGNCTDFHSLFISLARAKSIPARFEIGFSVPSEGSSGNLSGYHCWGWFHDPFRGWIPVDISEADKNPELAEYYFANLSADRVAFSAGRDIVLEPPAQGQPLNFFIAPYCEVNGIAVDPAQIKQHHRWTKVTAD